MKLIGNYTCPYVRKISVTLLEKDIPFEFVNTAVWVEESAAVHYNPLGKVPALVTDEGEIWFDSPIIAGYLELLTLSPSLLPWEAKEALQVRQLEALADGIMDAAIASVRERMRPPEQQSESELLRYRNTINRGLDALEKAVQEKKLLAEPLTIASIAAGCAIGYINFRRVAPGWCVQRPALIKLVETLFQRESFARTVPPNA